MRRKRTAQLVVEALESRDLLSTFYVAPTGADSAAGSAQAPWLTLQHAANLVQPGDTVIVQPGTYKGFDLTTSGTAAARITFKAQSGVVINQANGVTQDGINLEGASYITIDGFTVTGMSRAGIRAVTDQYVTIVNNTTDHNGYWGIFSGFSNYIDIENNIASNSSIQHGIYVSNSAVSPTIRNNTAFGNAMCGIHLNGDVSQGGTGVVTGALIVGNVIHDNGVSGGSGINGDGVQNSIIENNVLYNNHASGISLYMIDASAGAKNNLIANNTIVMASNARWALNIQDGSTGNTAFNNILYDNNTAHGSIDISADSLPGFVSDYNVVMSRFTTDDATTVQSLAQWQSSTGQDRHSVVSTPAALFANLAANDYHLLAGSPAVDAGTVSLNGLATIASDIAASPRPSGAGYDVGAYELQQAAPPTPPAPPALPTASVTGPSSGTAGQSLTFTLGASETGLSSTAVYTFTIAWGDSTSQTVTGVSGTQVSHTFVSGSYSVQVTAKDSVGTSSAAASLSLTIAAPPPSGGATAVLQADPTNAANTALIVTGTGAADTITISPADTTGSLQITVNGANLGSFSPTGNVIVYGLAGNDTITLASAGISGQTVYVKTPALLFGGDGSDTLDARGSSANNALVGGAGADNLMSGTASDLLIGGAGADSLASYGTGAIEIGGSTSYDANLAALKAVLAEWGRTDVSYATRVKHLNGGQSGGLNGAYYLNTKTVVDDKATDYIYGHWQALDWFFAHTSGSNRDQVNGKQSGETVTAL